VRARLLCRVRSGQTRAFELAAEDSLIGRDDGLAVTLPFEEVSRQHAKISWDGKSHWLEDLDSTNGTYLNGRRVASAREKLRHLNVVTLGAQTDLVFVLSADETETLRRSVIRHAFLIRGTPDALPHELRMGEFTVGRSPGCNIVSDSPEVSKMHARLLRSADKLIVRDLGSANGTWVNGVRVSSSALVDGDLLSFAGDQYRVSVAMAEITSSTTSALRADQVAVARETPPAAQETPRFSTDWKQRVEGLEKPMAADQLEGDDTSRGKAASDRTLHPGATAAGTPAQAAALRLELRLVGEEGELAVKGGGSYVVGSGERAALRVAHASVAPAHARLIVSDILGSAFVQAEDGETLKNGEKVEKTEPLDEGDELRIGDVRFKIALRRVE
jgi:pSer/pThr/pTyr-binding forkhead associated (FHA) protein